VHAMPILIEKKDVNITHGKIKYQCALAKK
jgi:hypothetical protein